jgi:glutamate dehydrogenase (NAD(P)+)
VVDKLFRTLEQAFAQTMALVKKEKLTLRQAALSLGIKRVHEARKLRGLFP